MLWVVLLIVGLALVIFGADLLVRGASGLARRLGVSPLAIGMTVVAFGTSTPEIAINSLSAASGKTDLALGNIVGSCLANIGFVLAISAMIRPLRVQLSVITREVPMLMLSAVALLVLCADRFLRSGEADVLSRQDGVILLLLFCVFIYYTSASMISGRSAQEFMEEVEEAYPQKKNVSWRTWCGWGLGWWRRLAGRDWQ